MPITDPPFCGSPYLMRLDVFLKLSRLLSSRSIAKEMCDSGLVLVNGVAAKSSREVRIGDCIEIHGRSRIITAKIARLPSKKQVSRAEALLLYDLVGNDRINDLGPLPL